jgi:hypothetical protein
MKMARVTVLAAFGLVFLAAAPAKADMLITSRSALGGTDHIDWGVLGPATPGATLAAIPSPSTLLSAGGVSFTISESPTLTQNQANFMRYDQVGSAVPFQAWYGNFSPGDHLLFTGTGVAGGGMGPIVITSNGPLMVAAGTQIQANLPGPFTAIITTFDANGNPISSFTETGDRPYSGKVPSTAPYSSV